MFCHTKKARLPLRPRRVSLHGAVLNSVDVLWKSARSFFSP